MTEVAIPKVAKNKLLSLLADKLSVEQRLNSYAEGLKDGLGLEGDYNLNTRKMVFEPVKREE